MSAARWIALMAAMGLVACGPALWVPEERKIDDLKIPDFTVAGDVVVTGTESTAGAQSISIWRGGRQYVADYGQVSAKLAERLKQTIDRNARVVKTAGPRTLRIEVLSLRKTLGGLVVEVAMDGRDSVVLQIAGTEGGDKWSEFVPLDGMATHAVIQILSNPDVVAYLAGSAQPAMPASASQPKAATPAPAAAPASTRLQQLKALRDQGLISEADYERKKKEILDSM